MKIHCQNQGAFMSVVVRGDLDETISDELNATLTKASGADLVLDMQGVELINSLGARHWISFVQGLSSFSKKISFVNCSPTFVEGLNLYPRFTGNGHVDSVFMPCTCKACEGEELKLILMADFVTEMHVSASCKTCGGVAEPSVEFEDYFQFVKKER